MSPLRFERGIWRHRTEVKTEAWETRYPRLRREFPRRPTVTASSSLAQQYGGIPKAASALGYANVTALQSAIHGFLRVARERPAHS